MTSVALIGLGEVGRVLAEDLVRDGGQLTAWDIAFDADASRASTNAAELGLSRSTSAESAVAAADLVVSAVTAANDLAAAVACASGLRPGSWFLDLNSSSPGQKQAAAQAVENAGGRYVEAAVMAPIGAKRLGTSLLLGGPWATEFELVARGLGFSAATPYSPVIGRAAATKLCRSVVIKGLEALVTESLLTARVWGVEREVLGSLSNLVPVDDWEALATYLVSRSLQHGERRAEELLEAAATVAESGVDPIMAAATARRQAWAGVQGHTVSPAGDLDAMLTGLRAGIQTGPSESEHA